MSTRRTSRAQSRPASILVVEDDGLTRRILQSWIEGIGHRVVAVSSGEEALEVMAGRAFDLLVVDCNLPGLNGVELARRVRRGDAAKTRPAMVAVTASQAPEETERCLGSGFDHLVRKPLDQEKLEAELDRWLGREPRQAAVEAATSTPPLQDLPHLDRETLRRAAGGSETQADELAAELVVALESRVSLLAQMVDGQDWTMVAREGHRIMGSCGTLGALRLAEIAAHLREEAETGDSGRVRLVLEELRQEVAEVQAHANG